MRHRNSAVAGTFDGRTARTATAHRARRNASRSGGVFCAATGEHFGRQGSAWVSRGSGFGCGSDRAIWIGLRAFGRRCVAEASQGEVSREAGGAGGTGAPRGAPAELSPFSPEHFLSALTL